MFDNIIFFNIIVEQNQIIDNGLRLASIVDTVDNSYSYPLIYINVTVKNVEPRG